MGTGLSQGSVVKWSGSKRSQAGSILNYFPDRIETYYEPFLGGASVFHALYRSGIQVKRYVLSDINSDLIGLYKVIRDNPEELYEHYEELWRELNKDDDVDRKKEYFTGIRDRFNREKDPKDFLFIMRTCINGMPRYNDKGEFNSPFHITRSGIYPQSIKQTIYYWSSMLEDVELESCSYEKIQPEENDYMYLDPPYANTKGMYYGAIDCSDLWKYLRGLKCKWSLSFDGKTEDKDSTYDVPSDIYDKHLYIKSGNSSFRRVLNRNKDVTVYESLYIKD